MGIYINCLFGVRNEKGPKYICTCVCFFFLFYILLYIPSAYYLISNVLYRHEIKHTDIT